MKLNKCPPLEDLFVAFIEGRFDTTESLLKIHVNQCPVCANALQTHLHTWSRLGQVPEVQASTGFEKQLQQRLSTELTRLEQQTRFWHAFDLSVAWLRVPVLAGVLLLALSLRPTAPFSAVVRQQLQLEAGQKIQRLVKMEIRNSVFLLGKIYKKYKQKRRIT